ncbi:MAG: glycosyltransferase [Chlorobiales bacterium]|nr:glycosyltransferase [Chlorobiales bacterium]
MLDIVKDKRKALIVLFKWPKPGNVKTRLVPFLTHEEAAQLYEKFVLDSFETAMKLQHVDVFGYVAGETDETHPMMSELEKLPVKLRSQHGDGLCERIANAFKEVFQLGYDDVAVIGTDSPDLPLSFINSAFDALDMGEPALCIGPSEDGGYYLLGMNCFFPEVFQGVPYSSSKTYIETVRTVMPLSLFFFPLRLWHDVDEKDDLKKLMNGMGKDKLRHSTPILKIIASRMTLD